MMSEISFTSLANVSTTPVARSRRISTLPLSHADLSSPATAAKQLHILELENVALDGELMTAQDQIQSLKTELEALRSTLAAPCSEQMLSSASSSSILAEEQRSSAEIKSAKRLLHRLLANITSHSSSEGMDEDMFSLDRSMVHDPERSVLEPACTHLTTPNGKTRVARRFEGDLLDDIEALGQALKDQAGKVAFEAAEKEAALVRASASNQRLSVRVQQLEDELVQERDNSTSIIEKDQMIDELRSQVEAGTNRERELQNQLQASQTQAFDLQQKLSETCAKLDQITAEQELTISAAAKKSAAQIEALTMQLEEAHATSTADGAQESCSEQTAGRTTELESQLASATAQLTELQSQRETAELESTSKIGALQAELDQRRSKSSELQSIFTELQEKKQRLHAIQLHNSKIALLQRVLVQQERIVDLLDRQHQGGEWIEYAQQLGASLAQLQCESTATKHVVMTERVEATTNTDDVEAPTPAAEVDDHLIPALKAQIDELEARILRRNEQIGSLQRQLKNVENDLARSRTNQRLAEETVMELDAEKDEHLERIKGLQEQVAHLESAHVAPTVDSELPTPSSEVEMQEMQESLTTTRQQVSTLSSQLEQLTADNASLVAEKEALVNSISHLTQQVQHLETDLVNTKTLDQQREEEISTLKLALRKADERLTSTKLDMDALQLSLAEQRESASQDADRIESLESRLSTVEAERSALVASSAAASKELEDARGSIAELTSTISILETESDTKRCDLESLRTQFSALAARHTELEQVLAQRDAAINERNAEYWTLKEELAELQEEAERSRTDSASSTSPALVEVQEQLSEALKFKSELEERIAAQEAALLRLKSDLTAARSTEELLNAQYEASQRRVKDLEAIVSSLESSITTNTTTGGASAEQQQQLTSQLDAAQAEIGYLTTRIGELEDDLGRKADEIEEADSKILDALKESKKYATRYTKLSGKFEALQGEVKAKDARVREVEDLLREAREARVKKMVRSASGGGGGEEGGMVAGRKRSKPDSVDDVEQGRAREGDERGVGEKDAATPSRPDAVKAVYAPSPSTRTPASSFTPVRRALLSKSTSRSHKKPAVASSTATATAAAATTPHMLLGHGTPSAIEAQDGGMVRSTSNPSELIAARFGNSSSPEKPKLVLLSDKTNLSSNSAATAAGTSRLSSKVAGGGGVAAGGAEWMAKRLREKSVSSALLPTNDKAAMSRGDERKALGGSSGTAAPAAAVVGGGGGGGAGGAADFLARMKAQRAATAAAAAQRA